MLQTKKIEYFNGKTLLEGFYAFDNTRAGTRPVVLVVHDWSGRNEFACKKAEELAKMGYVGFALDMFGKNVIGTTNEEKAKLITPFMDDRDSIIQCISAAIKTLKSIEEVDISKIAAIGFCFGGLCVLDLARRHGDICGVVSFHGLLMPIPKHQTAIIKTKILALHGHDDPMAPPEQVAAFQKEMTTAGADWQMHIYGKTMHAFTNPLANDPDFGTVYNETVKNRAWKSMQDFLKEIFI